jgi:hypothetical protein
MLLFRSEEMVERWCRRIGVERGETLTPEQVWELSKLWYHNRLSVDYHGRTAEEAEKIFRQVGLGSEFWSTRS